MIKTLEIKNYQSHKDSRLSFVPGVNVIIGSTDAGKSGLMKAMLWAVNNKPNGDDMRSHWGGDIRVTLRTDRATVIRAKDKRDEYFVGTAEGTNLLLLKAFGVNVPEEVSKALNLSPLNIHRQFDSHYLLSASPGEVSKHFNRITNIEVIDRCMANIKSNLTRLKSQADFRAGELKKAEDLLPGFDYLDKFEMELEVLEDLHQSIPALEQKALKLSRIITETKRITDEIQKLDKLVGLGDIVREIATKVETRDHLTDDAEELALHLWNIDVIDAKIQKASRVLKAEAPMVSLLEKIKERDTMEAKADELNSLLYSISMKDKQIKETAKEVKTCAAEFTRAMPDVCPLCGRSDDDHSYAMARRNPFNKKT